MVTTSLSVGSSALKSAFFLASRHTISQADDARVRASTRSDGSAFSWI